MTVSVNRFFPHYEETFSVSNKLTRSQSCGDLRRQKIFVATLLDDQQTSHSKNLPEGQVETLLQKFKCFWNEVAFFLQRNLIYALNILYTLKISKLGGFSLSVIKIKSIFSFTWQQSSSSTAERIPPHLNVQGAYIEHQIIVINVLPDQSLSRRE
jgi:hypothetical protein